MRQSLAILYIFLNSALGFGQVAEFSFNKPTYKFPKTNEGVVLKHYYVFRNSGNAPLVISAYSVGCHCTEVTFPTYPILPGKTDSILVVFKTEGKYYQQDRTIILTSNAKKKEYILRFKVFVVPWEE
jgi:hypothetical protein